MQGINEILPDELKYRRTIMKRLADCFEDQGFSKITTPTFEPYDNLAKGWESYLKENSIQFFNDQGLHMVLRPEMTTPIARLVCSRKEQLSTPLKLYYMENVFRKNHILRKNEFMQIGLEYLGNSSLDADRETVKTLIDLLLSVNIKNFKVEIGHVENIQNKSEAEINALKEGKYQDLAQIPLIGDSSILLEKSQLQDFANSFNKQYPQYEDYLSYNLGMVEDISYYTGIMFKLIIEGVGYIVGSGGRYDNLLNKFGWDIPAVGFALEFDKLAMALKDGAD